MRAAVRVGLWLRARFSGGSGTGPLEPVCRLPVVSLVRVRPNVWCTLVVLGSQGREHGSLRRGPLPAADSGDPPRQRSSSEDCFSLPFVLRGFFSRFLHSPLIAFAAVHRPSSLPAPFPKSPQFQIRQFPHGDQSGDEWRCKSHPPTRSHWPSILAPRMGEPWMLQDGPGPWRGVVAFRHHLGGRPFGPAALRFLEPVLGRLGWLRRRPCPCAGTHRHDHSTPRVRSRTCPRRRPGRRFWLTLRWIFTRRPTGRQWRHGSAIGSAAWRWGAFRCSHLRGGQSRPSGRLSRPGGTGLLQCTSPPIKAGRPGTATTGRRSSSKRFRTPAVV